jgi:hypothetical protein
MKFTDNEEADIYAWCVSQGITLEIGKLSLCDLRNFRYSEVTGHKRKYQIYYGEDKDSFSVIYEDPKEAAIKFVELKKRIRWRNK